MVVHSSCCQSRFNFSFSVTWGSLVSTGIRTSSLLLYHPRFYPSLYRRFDREFRETCCGVANLCGLYQKRRPPNNCTGYNPPVWCKFWDYSSAEIGGGRLQASLSVNLYHQLTTRSLPFLIVWSPSIAISQIWMGSENKTEIMYLLLYNHQNLCGDGLAIAA